MKRNGKLWPPRGPARVLVASQHPPALTFAAEHLRGGAYASYSVGEGGQAIGIVKAWRPHLVLADIELLRPDFRAAVRARSADMPAVPLMALVGTADLRCRLDAFDLGADDVLAVPFFGEELLARIRSLLRRAYAEMSSLERSLRIGGLEIDAAQHSVRRDGVSISVTPLQFALLYLLASNAGQVVTRDQILDVLWGIDHAPATNVVDSLVRSLRARLEDDFRQPRFIATVPGQGYRFVEPSSPQRTAAHGRYSSLRAAS